VGAEDGLVRLSGMDRPIDVFYLPNELAISDFEEVWERSTALEHGLRLIEKIDLMAIKQLTEGDRSDRCAVSQREGRGRI
jgi:hypothetical protein